MRGDMAEAAEAACSLGVETRAMRRHGIDLATVQDHGHGEIAVIEDRLNRIERRPEPAD